MTGAPTVSRVATRAAGKAVARLSAALPLTLGIDALRQIMFPEVADAGLMPVWLEAVLLAVLAVALIALARFALARLQRRAREEGRLTVRWL